MMPLNAQKPKNLLKFVKVVNNIWSKKSNTQITTA